MIVVPLLIEFAPQTSLYRERDLVSHLPILRMGTGWYVCPVSRRIESLAAHGSNCLC
jgi:hypothetical protein